MGRMGEAGWEVQASSYGVNKSGGERCSRGKRVNGAVPAWRHMGSRMTLSRTGAEGEGNGKLSFLIFIWRTCNKSLTIKKYLQA